MILKSAVIISVFIVISKAAVTEIPQETDITYSTALFKRVPTTPDTKEKWQKHKHIESHKNHESNTPDSHTTTKGKVATDQSIKSNVTTQHKTNNLGDEKVINSIGSNHVHTEGSQNVHSEGPTRSHDSTANLERDSQIDVNSKERDQSLGNGKLKVDNEKAMKKLHEHVVKDINSFDHPDEDHVQARRIHNDDNDISNTDREKDTTRRTLKHGNGTLDITDSNNVVNKSDYNTHNSHIQLFSDTPEERKELNVISDGEESKDTTTTTEKTNVVRETPISTLQITDENNEESNNETEKQQKQYEKSISDKKGYSTLIKGNKYKEVNDNILEHTNTLTINKIPRSRTATPIIITLKAKALDKHHLISNERRQKEIQTKTPTTETTQDYNEESTTVYDFDGLPDVEDDKDGINNNEPQTEAEDSNENLISPQNEDEKTQEDNEYKTDPTAIKDDEETIDDNNHNRDDVYDDTYNEPEGKTQNGIPENIDENDNKNNNNFGAMVFLMPTGTNDDTPPSDFIDNAMESDIIQNLLSFLTSNNLSSKIMIAGPINDSNPDNLYNTIKNNVKSYKSTLGMAEININADIIQIHKTEGRDNSNDPQKQNTEDDSHQTDDDASLSPQ